MEKDIYFEWISMSKKEVVRFEDMYLHKKNEIINDLKKIFKEKYNIHINGTESTKSIPDIRDKCNYLSTHDCNK